VTLRFAASNWAMRDAESGPPAIPISASIVPVTTPLAAAPTCCLRASFTAIASSAPPSAYSPRRIACSRWANSKTAYAAAPGPNRRDSGPSIERIPPPLPLRADADRLIRSVASAPPEPRASMSFQSYGALWSGGWTIARRGSFACFSHGLSPHRNAGFTS
jgi:hypothetical protein